MLGRYEKTARRRPVVIEVFEAFPQRRQAAARKSASVPRLSDVQHEPRNTHRGFQLRRIDLVAQQRMADGEHMDADLVGTPGEQMHIQISRAA